MPDELFRTSCFHNSARYSHIVVYGLLTLAWKILCKKKNDVTNSLKCGNMVLE